METDDLEKLLEGTIETPQLDFKESCAWNPVSFAKDILAMSNMPDGGRIVIGVSERDKGNFIRVGIKTKDKATYKIDTMKDQLAKYTDPFVEFSLYFPKDINGTQFCVIRIDPFKEVPIICKTDAKGLVAGGIYYRNRNKKVESALISNSYDMRDLIERSMLKMRYRAKQIGYKLSVSTDSELTKKVVEDQLRDERGDL